MTIMVTSKHTYCTGNVVLRACLCDVSDLMMEGMAQDNRLGACFIKVFTAQLKNHLNIRA